MSEEWTTVSVDEIKAGDTIRLQTGQILEVTKIEEAFMGRPEMRAFIEDTSQRWYKQPMPTSATVEVRR
jgi:hypothetical protein